MGNPSQVGKLSCLKNALGLDLSILCFLVDSHREVLHNIELTKTECALSSVLLSIPTNIKAGTMAPHCEPASLH